jgi:phosphate transport system protein
MLVHFEKEMVKLRKQLMQIVALVEESVRKAVVAVDTRDEDLANEVIKNDDEIDRAEVELEEGCLKILALHHPIATDLRYVVACMKINNDLERIGDLAVNIAQRAISISSKKEEKTPINFSVMMSKTQEMLVKSINSMIGLDPVAAEEVRCLDDGIDELNREMYKEIIKMIKDKPKRTKYFLHLLGVSRQLERIADYASNIAEDVIYLTKGKIVRHSHLSVAEDADESAE